MTGTRMPPFYCPYCGEEDIRPAEPTGWLCQSCRRAWRLEYLGVTTPEETDERPRT